MGKHKNHVDRKRTEHGSAYTRERLRELERANRRAPVVVYYVDSPTFIVYVPPRRRKTVRC